MASSGRKPSNNTTRRKKASTASKTKTTPSKKQIDSVIEQEVIALILFCIALILFLCMINVIKGTVGPAIKSMMLGVFGLLGYIMPIIMFLGICFRISNHGNQIAMVKLTAGVILMFLIGMLICYITGTDFAGISIRDDFIKELYHIQNGGGVVFGLLALCFYNIFGKGGSIFVLILLIIISLVVLTEKSFLTKVKDQSRKIYHHVRGNEDDEDDEDTDTANEEVVTGEDTRTNKGTSRTKRQIRIQEEEEKRRHAQEIKEDERILGNGRAHKKINFNDEIEPQKPQRNRLDDIHEITINPVEIESEPVKSKVMPPVMAKIIAPEPEIKIHSNIAKIEEIAVPTIKIPEPEEIILNTKTEDLTMMPQPVTERTHMEPKAEVKATVTESAPIIVKARKYEKPKLNLLNKNEKKGAGDSDQKLKETALLLQQTLKTFGVAVTVTDISQGPSVTRYELQLGEGIKVNKIVNLADDIKLNLAAQDIRIEAPIPGKAAVGIEIPNKETSEVLIRDLLETTEFRNASSDITFAVGKDISGKTIVADIAKMPHMLIAGATGSGKSVCINTLIMSILYKASPEDVKLIMIDPKVVELSVYNGIPHLMIPVVTDPKKANAALQWAVAEMTKRYQAFADFNLRDLKGYNQKWAELNAKGEAGEMKKMPQIIVIVDELADLMMVASKEVEESICRLAQLARAAGIHLIIATQRPSVDVITGLIKANMPSRVAFKVTSGVDSRTILDMIGAEKLLGKGDMLFYPQGYTKPLRVQGAFVSDKEVGNVVEFLKKNAGTEVYDPSVESEIAGLSGEGNAENTAKNSSDNSFDAYFDDACRFVVEKEKASSGMLQRVFKVGYTRAARIVDQMEAVGVVGPEEGTKPRRVLMDSSQLENFLRNKNS